MSTVALLVTLYLAVGIGCAGGGLMGLRHRSRQRGIVVDSAMWSRAWFLASVVAVMWPAVLLLLITMLNSGIADRVIGYVSSDDRA